MRCALVGVGMVAATHVAACKDSSRVTLAGVLGRDPTKARDFAGAHGIARTYADIRDLAEDPEIDFVILATPPDAREAQVAALAEAGKPILMEKPVERTLAAATRIVETCEAAGVPLGILFQHRARAASAALKAAVDAGRLGQVAHAEIRVPWWRDQSYYDDPGRGTFARDGGGVMITQAIHTLDLALWLMGPVARVQAIMHRTPLHRLEAEDWAGALLQLDSGAVATLMATTAAWPGRPDTIAIQGTDAMAQLSEGILTLHHLDGREEVLGSTAASGSGADPMAFTHAWHQAVIEDFAEAVMQARPPLAPGRETLRSQALIDAMQEAGRTGGTVDVAAT